MDVSTRDRELELGLIPLATILDSILYSTWRQEFYQKHLKDGDRIQQFNRFETEVYHRFLQYRVPTIEMKKQTPKEAVCQVFEKVNTGGVTLTVFELLTATFAADDYNLRDDWDARAQRLCQHEPLKDMEATDFLTSLTVDIHHVFPRAYCEFRGYEKERWNSIVNKAPLTARTNRIVGGRAPSAYLAFVQQRHDIPDSRMDSILASHAAVPALMRSDDFSGFLRARGGALLDLVEKATGKQIAGRDSQETITAFGGPLPQRSDP